MTYRWTIPDIPPSNNQSLGRENRWAYQAEKKRWAHTVQMMCTPKPKKPIEKCRVTLTYYFKNRTPRDPDNYSGKYIMDGLVRCGVIKDDNFTVVKELVIKSGPVDAKLPRIEICVEEV